MRDNIKVGLLVCLCLGSVLIFAAWPVIRIVSPILIIALASLIVVGVIAVSVRLLTRGIAPLVDAVFDWRMKAKQLRAMDELIDNKHTFISSLPNITAAAYPRLPAPAPDTTDYAPSLPAPRPLLSAVGSHRRSLITGSQDGGKTTVLMYLAETKVREGARVYALDPHAPPFKWPDGVTVIGAGRGYSDISEFMRGIFGETASEHEDCELNRRYTDIYEGRAEEESHPLIYIVSDEWMTVSQHIGLSMPVKKSFFTETRKASIGYAIVSHDTTVEALDLKGIGGLRDDFQSVITCEKDSRTKAHSIEVRYGWSRKKPTELVVPPGPFRPFKQTMEEWAGNDRGVVDGEYAPTTKPATIMIPAVSTPMDISYPRPTGQAQTICQMYAEGRSFNEISRAINNGAVGGKQTAIIKGVLSNHGKL